MDTKYGVIEELEEFKDAVGGRPMMRARLIGEMENVWWYPVYGPLPDVGDTVRVVLSFGDDEPYIDTSVR